jgi:ribonucleases P/MRP protein subunit RPP40
MFKFAGGKAGSKCYVTYGTMGHFDPKQPPKRKPYSCILAYPYIHKVVLNVENPEEILLLMGNHRLTSSFQRSSMRL